MAVLYLLRCSDGSLYCGWTVDLERRVAAHASGRASKYTASRLPVEVAAAWRLPTQSDARRAEWALKQLSRPAKEELVAGGAADGLGALASAERLA